MVATHPKFVGKGDGQSDIPLQTFNDPTRVPLNGNQTAKGPKGSSADCVVPPKKNPSVHQKREEVRYSFPMPVCALVGILLVGTVVNVTLIIRIQSKLEHPRYNADVGDFMQNVAAQIAVLKELVFTMHNVTGAPINGAL